MSLLFRTYFRIFFFVYRRFSGKKVAVFDLDNTLFDTWPLRRPGQTEDAIYRDVKPFPRVVELVSSLRSAGHNILFITSRRYRYYPATIRSLMRLFPVATACSTILVEKAGHKLFFLRSLLSEKKTVLYYDDLSHNHEHG